MKIAAVIVLKQKKLSFSSVSFSVHINKWTGMFCNILYFGFYSSTAVLKQVKVSDRCGVRSAEYTPVTSRFN